MPHGACLSPTTLTWCRTIDASFFAMWPVLMSKMCAFTFQSSLLPQNFASTINVKYLPHIKTTSTSISPGGKQRQNFPPKIRPCCNFLYDVCLKIWDKYTQTKQDASQKRPIKVSNDYLTCSMSNATQY